MEDIFHWCREGNSIQVRLWLDDTEHDMNQGCVLRVILYNYNINLIVELLANNLTFFFLLEYIPFMERENL